MTPLEIAAKAAWNHREIDSPTWDRLPEQIQNGYIESMRAALLALADAEIDEAHLLVGVFEAKRVEPPLQTHKYNAGFRAILRNIANEEIT